MPTKRTRSTTDAQASTSQDTSITVIPETQLSRDAGSPPSDGELATADPAIQFPPHPTSVVEMSYRCSRRGRAVPRSPPTLLSHTGPPRPSDGQRYLSSGYYCSIVVRRTGAVRHCLGREGRGHTRFVDGWHGDLPMETARKGTLLTFLILR